MKYKFNVGDKAFIYLATNGAVREACEVQVVKTDEVVMHSYSFVRAEVKLVEGDAVFPVGMDSLFTWEEIVGHQIHGGIEPNPTRRYV